MAANHFIERQVLDLGIEDVEFATGAELQARDAFLNVGVRTLVKVLDEVAGIDEVLRLDRVVVDLGSLESKNFTEAFGDRLCRIARDSLKPLVDAAHGAAAGRPHASERNGQRHFIETQPDSSATPQGSHLPGERASEARAFISREQEVIEFVTQFLEFGTAPWWSLAEFPGDPQGSRRIGRAVLDAYRRNPAFRDQCIVIVERVPRVAVNRLVNEAWLQPLKEYLIKTARSGSGSQRRELRDNATRLLERVGYGPAQIEPNVAETVAGLVAGATCRSQGRSDSPPSGETTSLLAPTGRSALKSGDRQPGARMTDNDPAADAHAGGPDESDVVAFVEGAGIVLLHPFLPLLFQELGLVEDDEFVSRSARVRALRLLEYLTWGTTERAEFALTLEKRLCAIPDGHPLASVAPDDTELAEADTVLDAAIGHWSALKNTGREGLRTTFLQRSGKLVRQDDQDCLSVERQGVDVLLDTIPWSYGVLRLPWMDRAITVEW